MLKIKLARFGKKHQAHFRVVVNEARDKRDGSYVALLGHYAPTYQPKILDIDLKAYEEWVKKGAQPTETVAALYERVKSGKLFPEPKARVSKKAQAKLAAEKAAASAPKAETPEEAPAEAVEAVEASVEAAAPEAVTPEVSVETEAPAAEKVAEAPVAEAAAQAE